MAGSPLAVSGPGQLTELIRVVGTGVYGSFAGVLRYVGEGLDVESAEVLVRPGREDAGKLSPPSDRNELHTTR